MNELKSMALAAERLRRDAEPFLVATVVRVRGSSYRRPGARMLVTRDRWIGGSVSGGCIEDDVLRRGWWRTGGATPRLVTYDARGEDVGGWGTIGCNGSVDLLLEPRREGAIDPLNFVARCYGAQRRGAIATVIGGAAALGAHLTVARDGAVVGSDELAPDAVEQLASECRAMMDRAESKVVDLRTQDGPVEALIEAVLPPPRLFVLGAGHDVVPVVAIAETVGWDTVVCAASARFLTRERFAHAAEIVAATPKEIAAHVDASDRPLAVLMAHDYARDRACLAALLETRVKYIGVLGPRLRTARMMEELRLARTDARVHAPVGLALGAETPQEIALSIVAEAQAVLSEVSPTRLRDRTGSIHAPAGAAAGA